MGAPNGEIPQRSLTVAQISAMQQYTQDGIARANNADLRESAEEARVNFLSNILGGFLGVIPAIVAGIEAWVNGVVQSLTGNSGGTADLTGYMQEQANTLSDTSTIAYEAHTLATDAQSTSVDAVSTAEAAANQAAAADTKADIAYNLASYWESECMVASAEVLQGVNEVVIGLCQNVPTGRTRKITDLHIALSNQPGGLTLETRILDAANVNNRLVHTATLGANVTRISYNNLEIPVADKERAYWNVPVGGIVGSTPPNILQCLLFGVIL